MYASLSPVLMVAYFIFLTIMAANAIYNLLRQYFASKRKRKNHPFKKG